MFTSKEIFAPGVIVYKNAIPAEWNLIERYEEALTKSQNERLAWSKARVGYAEENDMYRNCWDFKYKKEQISHIQNPYVQELSDMHDLISFSLRECLNDYAQEYGVHVAYQEAINVVKYSTGEYFKVHSDDGEPYRCTVSAVGYINDNYSGGELHYQFFDKTYVPNAGDFVIFPSSYIYAHASLPVTEGTKYSLVIMLDRNEYAHRKDSPVYEPVDGRPIAT